MFEFRRSQVYPLWRRGRDRFGTVPAPSKFLAVLLAFSFICCSTSRAVDPSDARPPNILLIVADDQRPDTISTLGNSIIRTPALDRLVRSGSSFPRAITAMPLCTASRAEILTGRDGRQNGKADFGVTPYPRATSLASALSQAGYETCYVGKWHTSGRPSSYGYETTQGLFSSGNGKHPLTVPFDWKGMPVTGYRGWMFQTDQREFFPDRGVGLTPNISETFTEESLNFLDRRSDRPFFLHVNYTAPHDPLLIPNGFEKRVAELKVPLPMNFLPQHPFDHGNAHGRDELLFSFPRTPMQTQTALAVYYAVIEHLDAQIGRLLRGLQQRGLQENTLVIFTSDHGLAIGSHGLRGKQNMYDHTIGVPLILSGPGISKDKSVPAQCYLRDLYPTICDYAHVPIPESVQGQSLLPVIRGEKTVLYEAVIAHFMDSQRMVRTSEWKYIQYPLIGKEQLFHLASDPAELTDVIDRPGNRMILNQLRKRLDEDQQRLLHAEPAEAKKGTRGLR